MNSYIIDIFISHWVESDILYKWTDIQNNVSIINRCPTKISEIVYSCWGYDWPQLHNPIRSTMSILHNVVVSVELYMYMNIWLLVYVVASTLIYWLVHDLLLTLSCYFMNLLFAPGWAGHDVLLIQSSHKWCLPHWKSQYILVGTCFLHPGQEGGGESLARPSGVLACRDVKWNKSLLVMNVCIMWCNTWIHLLCLQFYFKLGTIRLWWAVHKPLYIFLPSYESINHSTQWWNCLVSLYVVQL